MVKQRKYITEYKISTGPASKTTLCVLTHLGSSPIKGHHCFLEQETYCLVLVGSGNRLERDFTSEPR